jgi:hypothetical protein
MAATLPSLSAFFSSLCVTGRDFAHINKEKGGVLVVTVVPKTVRKREVFVLSIVPCSPPSHLTLIINPHHILFI